MNRMFILCPGHEGQPDVQTTVWLEERILGLTAVDGVGSATVLTLASGSDQYAGDWRWLIELHLDEAHDPARVASHWRLREMLVELRVVGMSPRVAWADGNGR